MNLTSFGVAVAGLAAVLLPAQPLLAQNDANDAELRRSVEEYVSWHSGDRPPPEHFREWLEPLRDYVTSRKDRSEAAREAAWVLVRHEWAELFAVRSPLERQSAAWRLGRAVRRLEDECGSAPDASWVRRLAAAQSYLNDPAVPKTTSAILDRATLRNRVREALAAELAPSKTDGANGDIQKEFRDTFEVAGSALVKAALVRRMAAETLRDLYGTPDSAPDNFGKNEKSELFADSVLEPIAKLLRDVYGSGGDSHIAETVFKQYSALRGMLDLKPGEDFRFDYLSGIRKNDGSYVGLSPEQIEKKLGNNDRSNRFLDIVNRLSAKSKEKELAETRAMCVRRDGAFPWRAGFPPYEKMSGTDGTPGPLRKLNDRLSKSQKDDFEPEFWKQRFAQLAMTFGVANYEKDGLPKPRGARLFTDDQQRLVSSLAAIVSSIGAPDKLYQASLGYAEVRKAVEETPGDEPWAAWLRLWLSHGGGKEDRP